MDRTTRTRTAITTAVIGAAIAAGTLGFTSGSTTSVPSDHDSFRRSNSYSTHDSARTPRTGADGSVSVSPGGGTAASTSMSASFTGNRGQSATVTDAPRSGSETADRDRLQVNLVSPDVRLHDSGCADTPIFELTGRDAIGCGLDAADWTLVLVSDTHRNLVATAGDVKDVAVDSAGQAARDARSLVLESVQTVNEVTDRATGHATDLAGQAVDTAGQVARTTRDLAVDTISTVGDIVLEHTSCATGLTGDLLDTSINDALDCAS